MLAAHGNTIYPAELLYEQRRLPGLSGSNGVSSPQLMMNRADELIRLNGFSQICLRCHCCNLLREGLVPRGVDTAS